MIWSCGVFLEERYQLVRRLAETGNRQTWLAYDSQTEKSVLLKALFFAPDEQLWQDQRLAERETATLMSIQHPAVPRCLEVFWLENADSRYYCRVIEYFEGESLAEKLQRTGPLPQSEVEQIASEVLAILSMLHTLAPPVVHRDIKPANLIARSKDGQIALIDFGAVQAENSIGRTFTVVGTHGYTAPEQFSGQATPASDLYSLGATLLHLLTGRDPSNWPRKGLRLILDPTVIRDNKLRTWLGRLLEPDPTNRFRDAEAALVSISGSEAAQIAPLRIVETTRLHVEVTPDRLQVEIEPTKKIGGIIIILIFLLGALGVIAQAPNFPTSINGGISFTILFIILLPSALFRLLQPSKHTRLVLGNDSYIENTWVFGLIRKRDTLDSLIQPAIAEHNSQKISTYAVGLVCSSGQEILLVDSLSQSEAMELLHILSNWLPS